jgi:type 1 glutamine amidotransferase/HEAT repeat protein
MSSRWLLGFMLSLAATVGAVPAPVRVLILSGQNNHDWRTTTPWLRQLCETSGRFAVTVSESPATLGAADLAASDVLLSNWNTFGAAPDAGWPAELRPAFIAFVRAGKGLVSVHAGTSSFPEWDEYQDLVMGSWKLGQTGHGQLHAFPVAIAQPEHPVTRGLSGFWIEDELWHGVPLRGEPTALATAFSAATAGGSGKTEPIVLARSFGQGRSLTLLLGHDLRAMRNPAFGALLTRGLEWAATGEVTLPPPPTWPGDEMAAALLGLRDYGFGQDRQPLVRVETLVQNAAADPTARAAVAARLAALLADPASTVECRRFCCVQLALVGTPAEVAALARCVGDADLDLAARGALERLGGEAAVAALRQCLTQVPEAQRPGVAASLGRLRDRDAVTSLAQLVDPARPVLALAAFRALAAIGTPEALAALMALDAQIGATLRAPWSEAVLSAAFAALDQGTAANPRPAFARLTQADCPAHVRRAALRQTLSAAVAGRAEALGAALRSGDAVSRGAVLDVLRESAALPGAEAVAVAATAFDTAAADTQSQLIAVLEARGGPEALRVVCAAVASPVDGVRRRAIAAVGMLGDGECVPLLASRAAEATGDEARALTAALSRLGGATTDAALATAVEGALPHAVPLLVEALLNRRAKGAIPVLLQAAGRGSEPAQAAVRALGELGDDATFARLVALVAEGRCEVPETTVRQALTDIAQRRAETPARPALTALATVPDSNTRALLIGVLGALGGDEALAAVQAGLAPANPAVRLASLRALSGWQTAAPCEMLVGVLETSADPVEQVLAARGVARMLGEDSGRPIEIRGALLRRAGAAARTTEPLMELLKGASAVRSPLTLETLLPHLAPGSTSATAAQAILALADELQGTEPGAVARALRAVAAECYDSALQDRAALACRGVIAGPNLAVGASADSRDGLAPDNQGRGPEAAIDGNPATYWDDQDDQPAYHLAVTLRQPALVAAIAITGYVHQNYAPRDFEVVCDGKVMRTVTGATYENNRLVVALPPSRAQTLELRISGYYGKSPAVRELEIFGPPLAEPGAEKLEWERSAGAISLLNGGRTVWRFNYAPGHAKPYFHPLALKDGTCLTWTSPPDHPWHHGLWFSWKLINGLNYWEEDKATGQSQGLTTWAPAEIETRADGSALIRLRLAYGPPGGTPVLHEERTVAISSPAADGSYHLDWTLGFTAVAEQVVLERTPIPGEPDGVAHGGYAGLSARLARDLVDWKVSNADGLVGVDAHRKPATALDFSGSAAGVAAGIAILDHPGNLNAPSPWFVVADPATPFAYFSPAVVCLKPHTLRQGQTLALRYRVLVHPGALAPAGLQAAHAEFVR